MTRPETSHLEIARSALDELPDQADPETILFVLDRRLNQSVEPAPAPINPIGQARGADSSWLWDGLGCIGAALIMLVMAVGLPMLFSFGERLVGRPARVSAVGVIREFQYADGSAGTELIGRTCRVSPDHVMVEADGATLVIPSSAYRTLKLNED